jgi:hypothetical protein
MAGLDRSGAARTGQNSCGQFPNSDLLGAMKTNSPQYRTIKVELAGDRAQRKTFPKIPLQGLWLQKLGFTPPGRIAVRPIGTGVVVLRLVAGHLATGRS